MTKEKGGVTAPTEPLTLTPEQQAKLDHLVEREMDEAYYTGTYMKARDARACLREFAVEVLEELGVPVVMRDDAAELRAALEGLVPVALALTDLAVSGFDLPPGTVTAIAKARAALAATEGQA